MLFILLHNRFRSDERKLPEIGKKHIVIPRTSNLENYMCFHNRLLNAGSKPGSVLNRRLQDSCLAKKV